VLTRRNLFILIIVLQLLALAGMVLYKERWLARGTKILLKTQPVDPRDLFRGDYVRLGYEISSIDVSQLLAGENIKRNDPVYVTLGRTADGSWQPLSFARTQPKGVVFIAGRAQSAPATVASWDILLTLDDGTSKELRPTWFDFREGDRIFACVDRRGNSRHMDRIDGKSDCWDKEWTKITGTVATARQTSSKRLSLEYGIENYFVEEGKGRNLEKAQAAKELQVEVSLRPDGRALINRLLLDNMVVK
jgi:uncharacterized membrane-anchored protein